MKYFDVVSYQLDSKLAKRLGYSAVLTPDDVELRQRQAQSTKRYIMLSADQGALHRALKDPYCLGIVLQDNTLDRKVIEQLRHNEKHLFILASELVGGNAESSLRRLGRARKLFMEARKAGASVAMVSMAKDSTLLLSSMQMIGLARLLGADEAYAKEMVGWWAG